MSGPAYLDGVKLKDWHPDRGRRVLLKRNERGKYCIRAMESLETTLEYRVVADVTLTRCAIELGIPAPELVFTDDLKGTGAWGAYDAQLNRIFIDEGIATFRKLKEVVAHEVRHAWQNRNFLLLVARPDERERYEADACEYARRVLSV
jgi:hypothetical protein